MEQVEPGSDGDINNQVEKCLISRGSQWHAASQKQLSSSWRQNTALGTEPGTQGASEWMEIQIGVSTQARKLDFFFKVKPRKNSLVLSSKGNAGIAQHKERTSQYYCISRSNNE